MTRLLIPWLALTTAASVALAQDAGAPPAEPAPAAQATPAAPAPAARVTYALQPASSDLYVVLRNDVEASLSRLGHDHVIYARTFTGEATWPNAAGGACAVSFSLNVRDLIVDPPGLREKAGLDDNVIDDGDKDKLSKNMWGKTQLDADTHPAIRFEATSCPGGTGKVPVSGTLTIRGVSKPVTITMDVKADGARFSARGATTLKHTDFGFKPFSASFVGPRNADALRLVVDVKGSAR